MCLHTNEMHRLEPCPKFPSLLYCKSNFPWFLGRVNNAIQHPPFFDMRSSVPNKTKVRRECFWKRLPLFTWIVFSFLFPFMSSSVWELSNPRLSHVQCAPFIPHLPAQQTARGDTKFGWPFCQNIGFFKNSSSLRTTTIIPRALSIT